MRSPMSSRLVLLGEDALEGVVFRGVVGQVVLPECGGNQGSSEFLEFVEWTKKALEIIQQPVQPKKAAPSNVGGIDFGSLLS